MPALCLGDVTTDTDIAIVGAGAAGLAAAIFAAESLEQAGVSKRIVILEGATRVGAKILISGGGRCNVTNAIVRPDDFNGSRPVVRNILAAFDEQATRDWFERLGVPLKQEETGKLFPVSDKARSVVDALLRRCDELNVSIRTATRVTRLAQSDAHLSLTTTEAQLSAACVIMATGGRSLPRTGSDGSGWDIVSKIGHSVTPTYPALVPLVLGQHCFHATLSGLSLPVELTTFAAGKRIDQRSGSLLWTHFGISGPVVMDASRFWVIAQGNGQTPSMRCSFVPGLSFEATDSWLIETAATRPRLSLARSLATKLPERLALSLIQSLGIDPGTPMAQVTREQRRRLVHGLTGFELPIERERGWDYAEVTAGGVPLNEIDYRSMASRRLHGLYLVGEILDCDGRIGGFNFQWAWATGYLAGRAAAASLSGPQSAPRVAHATPSE